MSGPKRTKMLLLAAIIIAGLLFFCLHKSEPTYQGKSLSKWLEQDRENNNINFELSQETKSALEKMGTNVIPYLVKRIGRKNSTFKVELSTFLGKLGFSGLDLDKAYEEQYQAAIAFKVFGAEAKCAIPSLTAQLVSGEEFAEYAVYALVNIGAESMPTLTNALFSTNPFTVSVVASSLPELGTNAAQAIPALLINLTSTNPSIRASSIRAFGSIRSEPSTTLPRLIEAMSDPYPAARRSAIRAIGKYSTKATHILPALSDLISDPDPLTQSAVINSIKNIEGTNSFLRFIDWLASTNAETRGAGVQALYDYANTNRSSQLALATLLQSTNENIRAQATNVLERLDPGGRRRRRSP